MKGTLMLSGGAWVNIPLKYLRVYIEIRGLFKMRKSALHFNSWQLFKIWSESTETTDLNQLKL